MKIILFLFILLISNLSHSYENNQLLLHNPPKKVDYLKFNTLDKKEIDIFQKSDNNKLYLLNFWATWCPPCIKEIPELVKLKKKYKDSIEVLFISVDSNPEKVIPKFLKKNRFKKLRILIDNKLVITKKLEVKIMPTTLIIEKNMNELSRVEGNINWLDNKILEQLESLL